MKITVELSDDELEEVCSYTGESKKGPAIRKMVLDALMLKRREAIVRRFVSGEWNDDISGIEEAQAVDKARSAERERAWTE